MNNKAELHVCNLQRTHAHSGAYICSVIICCYNCKLHLPFSIYLLNIKMSTCWK